MALQLVITNAGRAAVIDQANGGFRAVRIAAVGVSPSASSPTPAGTSLGDEVKRIATIAGEATATDVTHLTVTDESNDSYTVRSFALYLSDGTLFALYGQADPIVQKSAQALLLLSLDVMLSNIPAASITFGDANFTNPAATTERAGVVELATDDEAEAAVDPRRAASAKNLARYARLSGASYTGPIVVMYSGAAVDARADKPFLSWSSRDGAQRFGYLQHAGAGGDFFFANEQGGAFRFDIGGIQRLVVTSTGISFAADPGGLTRSGSRLWDAGNDGAGSGLDADLLDGRHGSDFALLSGASYTGPIVVTYSDAALDMRADKPFLSWSSRDGTRRFGYLQHTGDGGDFFLANEQGGAFRFDIGGTERFGVTSTGVTFNAGPGGLTRSGSRLWDAGNDGAGSGLDADLLDGRHAADFALLSGASYTGPIAITYNGAALDARADKPFLSWSSRDGSRRFGYMQHTGIGGDFFFANEQGGAIRFDIGGTERLAVTSAGVSFVADPGGLTRLGSRLWDAGNDGAGSGLDADLLDGRHAAEFALLSGATYTGPIVVTYSGAAIDARADRPFMSWSNADGSQRFGYLQHTGADFFFANEQGGAFRFDVAGTERLRVTSAGISFITDAGGLTRSGSRLWDAGNDGAGSGLDADLLDGREGSFYLPVASYTAGDVLAKAVTVDGAGSGLDADMVDGWHRDDIRDWNSLLNKPAAFPVAAHTHGAADIAGAFPGALAGNGYTVLPNGLILQWFTGAQQGAGSEGSQYVVFPIAFPNACFQVIASTQVANPNTESHATYQLISYSNEGATVMRQLVSTAGADREPSWPRLFAIGR